jgi:ferrous iron transport protein A
MPLSLITPGETRTILKISGKDETRSFLASLGFVEGSPVTVVSRMDGNLIVRIKDSRVAVSKQLATRITVG